MLQGELRRWPALGGLLATRQETLCGPPTFCGLHLRITDLSAPRTTAQQRWTGTTVSGKGTGCKAQDWGAQWGWRAWLNGYAYRKGGGGGCGQEHMFSAQAVSRKQLFHWRELPRQAAYLYITGKNQARNGSPVTYSLAAGLQKSWTQPFSNPLNLCCFSCSRVGGKLAVKRSLSPWHTLLPPRKTLPAIPYLDKVCAGCTLCPRV